MGVAGSAVVAGADQVGVPYAVLAAVCVDFVEFHGVAAASAVPDFVASVLGSELAIAVPVVGLEAEAGLVEGMEALGKLACVGHRQRALSAFERHSCQPCHSSAVCSLPVPDHRHLRPRRRRQPQPQPPQPHQLYEAYHEVGQYRVSLQQTVSSVSAVAGVGQLISPRRSDQPCEGDHVYAWEVAAFHRGRSSFEGLSRALQRSLMQRKPWWDRMAVQVVGEDDLLLLPQRPPPLVWLQLPLSLGGRACVSQVPLG